MFSHNHLPILGVTWTPFATEFEAIGFATWAIQSTANDEHPCDATIIVEDDNVEGERYVVKVSNW